VNRPQHSLSGFRRYMQMSRHSLFVLVEGKEVDPFFYSGLLRPVCAALGSSCDIVRADFVTGTGGKQTLLQLHKYLESVGSLILQVGSVRKSCIFYLDKDIDDLLGKLVLSKHVVYTPFYCVENVLFVYGRIVRAAAAASSLDPENLERRIPDGNDWRRQSAENWKEFLVLSLLSQRLGVNCDCHYARTTSPLNVPPEAPTDLARASAIRTDLQVRSGLNRRSFDLRLGAIRRYVDCVYQQGRHDRLFNGKWYFELLRREINIAAGGRRYNSPPTTALTAALGLTLDFEGSWSEPFRQPLRDLIGTPSPPPGGWTSLR
jgi:hypothetical protein